jgi:hypothetical protein
MLINRCRMPIPPSCAMAIAMCVSVTVSMFEDTMGIDRRIPATRSIWWIRLSCSVWLNDVEQVEHRRTLRRNHRECSSAFSQLYMDLPIIALFMVSCSDPSSSPPDQILSIGEAVHLHRALSVRWTDVRRSVKARHFPPIFHAGTALVRCSITSNDSGYAEWWNR